MATLLFKGQVLNSEDRHELFASADNSELFGYDVYEFSTDGNLNIYYNVTEVDWRYDTEDGVAYESDHHSTGITRDIVRRNIASVAVIISNKMNKFFHGSQFLDQ